MPAPKFRCIAPALASRTWDTKIIPITVAFEKRSLRYRLPRGYASQLTHIWCRVTFRAAQPTPRLRRARKPSARFVAQRRTLVMRFAIWIGEGMVWMRSGIKKLVALVFGIGVLACGLAVAQTAIDDLRTRAECGDAEAQNSLGLRYVLGGGHRAG